MCDTSKERSIYPIWHDVRQYTFRIESGKISIKNLFFQLYFFHQDFFFIIITTSFVTCNTVDNDHLEGTVSQIFF